MLLTAKLLINSLNHFWLHFKHQTQIIFVIISIMLLLFINILGLFSITTFQSSPSFTRDKTIIDIHFILSNSILLLVNEKRNNEIISFCENIYKNTTRIKAIIYIDENGTSYGIPYTYNEIVKSFKFLNNKFGQDYSINKLSSSIFSNTTLTASIINSNGTFFGTILILSESTLPIFNNIILINRIIFASLFLLLFFLIFIAFINLTITRPLNELIQGLNTIALGNFSTRINLRAGGQVADLIGNFNELNRRLQLYEEKNSEQLRSEKIKLETLITTITDGILLLDANLKIVLTNATAIKIFGWKTKTKLINTSIWDHLPVLLQKKLFVALQNVFLESKSVSFDCNIESDLISSPQKLIRVTLKIVYDSIDINKLPIGVGITIQDRTKEFEFDQVQTRFISNISHELRTPLFNIKSFIETIQEYDYSLSNWQKSYFLDIVNNETSRLTRLVNDILCISKLDSRSEIRLGLVNIVEIIQQTICNYQLVAHDKVIFLHSQYSSKQLNIIGNKDLLLQVLINLVGNALKFNYKYGEIVVRLYILKNKKARIEICDSGIGIADCYQPYIFQRFYRIENEVHTLKGAGLGLSIVNTILLEHNTNIKLISNYGVGSIFWFDLAIKD